MKKLLLCCAWAAPIGLAGCAAESVAVEGNGAPPSLRVTKAQIGSEWPLTIKEGVVSCDGTRLYFERDGKRYALNGMALMDESKTPDIFKSGWLIPDPVIPRSYKSVGPLQEKARSVCR